MIELIRANDIVLIGFARSLLGCGHPGSGGGRTHERDGGLDRHVRPSPARADRSRRASAAHPEGCRPRARVARAVSEADAFLGGRLHLRQPPRGAHRAGTDGVLLARLLTPEPGERLCDLGSGRGSSASPAPCCGRACPSRWSSVIPRWRSWPVRMPPSTPSRHGDRDRRARPRPGTSRRGLAAGPFRPVLTNPPFFEDGRYRPSPDALRAAAHGFPVDGLDRWIRTCASILRPGGTLGLIHRADALPNASQPWEGVSAGSSCGRSRRKRVRRRSAFSSQA